MPVRVSRFIHTFALILRKPFIYVLDQAAHVFFTVRSATPQRATFQSDCNVIFQFDFTATEQIKALIPQTPQHLWTQFCPKSYCCATGTSVLFQQKKYILCIFGPRVPRQLMESMLTAAVSRSLKLENLVRIKPQHRHYEARPNVCQTWI